MGTVGDASLDRVAERQRAVALARHYRESEGLSIAQIAERLGRAPATVKGYFYDPSGEKARAVKARYQGVCRGCGAPTQARNGKGDAYAYCKACIPGAIAPRWTPARVLDAMRAWQERYGRLPSAYDWSRTHACPPRRAGAEAARRWRLAAGKRRRRRVRELGGRPRRRAAKRHERGLALASYGAPAPAPPRPRHRAAPARSGVDRVRDGAPQARRRLGVNPAGAAGGG
jgi:hypothetical protein